MDSNKDHEKIAMEIAKTSDSIRKKYRALKTGKMEEEIALERHFKPITEPLKQIVENTVESSKDPINIETFFSEKDEEPKPKRKRPNASYDSPIQASTPVKSALNKSKTVPSTLNEMSEITGSRELSYDHAPSVEEVFEIANEPLVTSIRHLLQTSEGQEKLHANYGPLGQRYLKAVLSGKKAVNIDVVYGVYFSDEGTMLGDKRITLNKNDDIIIDGQRYDGTPGLYELIFMKFPNESICTDDDVQTYKSILLITNAYRRGHNAGNQVLGNKGHKYKNIIAPLVLGKKVGTGIKKKLDLPCAMSLTDNRIDYVHWDDPNELVDRLRLLEASRQAGHNGHDNEILSIIEELREAGLIIN
ncbi:hypothetical protein ALC62_13455 [Cyphomyrmex costatus]|uniref:DUF8207 domain-containing protein n=1 Tax=Cyphomyrmex costatus TaxID=456900 RepID=A0A151I9Z2_9HYME|nr:hypothetical protein ALC62_13455 [Cyphomyrmex costatus]